MDLPRDLRARLAAGEVLLADGATGTFLQQRGLPLKTSPETWNLERPDEVRGVARAYAEAGADLVFTNSLGGNPLRLAAHELADRCAEVNRAAASLAREGAGESVVVVGSIGPCGQLMEPMGPVTADEVKAGFLQQARALVEGGADALGVETMIDLNEAVLAVQAAREVLPDGVVMACATFNPSPRGWFTVMGHSVQAVAMGLAAAGADVVGSNCGQGITDMVEVAREFERFASKPRIIQSNAGLPAVREGRLHYPGKPKDLAAVVPDLTRLGVQIIGGCCGTTPEHVAAVREVLG